MNDDCANLLAETLAYLITARSPQGHWGDVRATALATWAFGEALFGKNASPAAHPELHTALTDAQAWLAGQAKREEGGVSWESQAWDTALATIALSPNEAYADRVDQAVAWLQRIADPSTGVWYEEIWETTLATVSILRAERNRRFPSHRHAPWLSGVLKWLIQIPSKENGEFICPHYSGFVAWLLGEVQASGLAKGLQETPELKQFSEKVDSALRFLLGQISESKSGLWSQYTFSNAYIAYGLSILSRTQRVDSVFAGRLVEWLKSHQGRCGGFEDIEDTSLAVLALFAILDRVEKGRLVLEKVCRLIPRGPRGLQKCFLGYSGKASPIALEIKDAMCQIMPSLQIMDWRWDFQPGHVLFTEIQNTSRECQVAVFLVTKDDTSVQPRGALASSPRDNIVFEVGFFAARLGMENTILVVEEGTKIPSDWGGILYVPLKNRKDLSGVKLSVVNAVKKLLRL